jgi:hypothetical protein
MCGTWSWRMYGMHSVTLSKPGVTTPLGKVCSRGFPYLAITSLAQTTRRASGSSSASHAWGLGMTRHSVCLPWLIQLPCLGAGHNKALSMFVTARLAPDEDITPSNVHNTPLDIQGPITRALARQLNLEVRLFLSTSFYDFKNRLLPVAEPPELFRLKRASHRYTGYTNSTHFKRNNPLVCRVTARYNHGSTGSKQVYLARRRVYNRTTAHPL